MMHGAKITSSIIVSVLLMSQVTGRRFTVNYNENTFMKDGKPFRYISGSMHYFRVPQLYWRDRVRKMKACGLDAVELYIPWNFHAKARGSYNFHGQRNVSNFLDILNEEGMLAIVRGFPYSDTEWNMGGLASWLLKSDLNPPNNRIFLRTSDSRFLSAVSDWLDALMPILRPHSYGRGGPIILVQIENEYGSYAYHDDKYLTFLYNELQRRMDDENVVFFTTDGDSKIDLQRGRVHGVLPTVDFGPGDSVVDAFNLLRASLPHGPLVNSEFYTGWLDHWGEKHHRTSSADICKSMGEILSHNASMNFYMFVGGTNFEYWSGSNGPIVNQIITSYDYDSPISENGDTTEKYFAIRKVISEYKTLPLIPVPPNVTRRSYGEVIMINNGPFWDHLDILSPLGPVKSSSPLSFEDLDVIGGFVLYSTIIKEAPPKAQLLQISNSARDFAKLFLNREYVGYMERGSIRLQLPYFIQTGDVLDILVESYGRICYGVSMNDSKGIDGNIQLIGQHGTSVTLTDWDMWVLNLENSVKSTSSAAKTETFTSPSIFTSLPFKIQEVADTFISFSNFGWDSGYVVVNGFILGKYNKRGPQKTLYLPTEMLVNDGMLQISLFETNPPKSCLAIGNSCSITLVDTHDLG